MMWSTEACSARRNGYRKETFSLDRLYRQKTKFEWEVEPLAGSGLVPRITGIPTGRRPGKRPFAGAGPRPSTRSST